MNNEKELCIDKVLEEFRPKTGTLMLMLSVKEYEDLVRLIGNRAYEYGWIEGMADAKYAKKSKA
jgi:hypothetical protein